MNMTTARRQIFYVVSQLRRGCCSNDEYHRQDKTSAAIFEEPYGGITYRFYGIMGMDRVSILKRIGLGR